jgi:hypothetical protein
MDGYVLWCLRFQARAAVPMPGRPSTRGRWTVREEFFSQVFIVFFTSSCITSFQSIWSVGIGWILLARPSAR